MILPLAVYVACLPLAITIFWCLLAPVSHPWFQAVRLAGITLSTLAAITAGLIQPAGVLGLLVLAGLVHAGQHSRSSVLRTLFIATALIFAIAMALHIVPGFERVAIYRGVLSPGSTEARIGWTLDKALAGLLLFGLYRPASTSPYRMHTLLAAAILMVCVLFAGYLGGLLQWSPKNMNIVALHWLFGNLFLTSFAEEVVFRFWLQNTLAKHWHDRSYGSSAAIAVTGLVFGLSHLAGGPFYALLAAGAGCAYGMVYGVFRTRLAPVLAHVGFNSVHFFLLTYPLAQMG
ncbi:CPBP family intramembrane glutamic endopeptidase [Chitinivorax sp. B]|uniref:CPBP family intramembrane glutamic endopeptidase n=1 Tax=Chitinivorax sp. B TaxID=2502235 RepID=UPI0010F58F11|nr:CPBP family intramembrane glutamic endopeptidase [Chitinivorax sp. B]